MCRLVPFVGGLIFLLVALGATQRTTRPHVFCLRREQMDESPIAQPVSDSPPSIRYFVPRKGPEALLELLGRLDEPF
jgi:hypothetical protein